jgi:hypothetical protein
VANIFSGFWPAFLPYLIGVVLIAGLSFWPNAINPGVSWESGDMDDGGRKKFLQTLSSQFIIIRPFVRCISHSRVNIAMMKQDFAGAEINMKKGLDLGNAHEGS